MKHRKQNKNHFENLDLDSLMDIMTCTVGLMLFIVIFAVLEAHGTRIKMFTPMVKDAPVEYERKLFLCQDGKIVLFDFKPAKDNLLGNWKINYNNVPSIVRSANAKNIKDDFFSYSFKPGWQTFNRFNRCFLSNFFSIISITVNSSN